MDSSPLISLKQIEMTDLLAAVFSIVSVPEAVAREVLPSVANLPPWIQVVPAPLSWPSCANGLGQGEQQVLGLALHAPTAIVVMDERRARRCAIAQGFKVRGTAGLLVDAKSAGVIPEIAPFLNLLVERGSYLDAGVRRQALLEAGELQEDD